MDAYANYRFCDSLDYLIPPVKKQHHFVKETERFSNFKAIRGSYVSIDSSTYKQRNTAEDGGNKSFLAGSTQISTTQVIRKHSVLDRQDKYTLQTILPFETKKRNKKRYSKNYQPVIKITVIPKSVETQTSKIFNKKVFNKKIKNTCSNHEGFHSNKFYSVSGIKREKIYKIKSSESDNISKRHIYHSNKMDKSIVKEKREAAGKKILKEDLRKCKIANCLNKKEFSGVNRHKSRVTIVGRLGLNNADKYVLNCAATVDDKPIHTNITQDMSMRNQYKEKPMETQGIQVNLNCDSSLENKKNYASMKHKYSQCECANVEGKIQQDTDPDIGYKNPIVVISVYPKENDGPMVKIEERQFSPNSKTEIGEKISSKQKKPTHEGSVSPARNEYFGNRSNNKILSYSTRTVSPDRFSNPTRKKPLLGTSKTDMLSKVNYNTKTNISKRVYQSRQETRIKQNKSNIESLDARLAKKALVDNYINKLDSEEQKNHTKIGRHEYVPPKDKASRVTVDIDGESERYNLLFKHDRKNTDFSVRKTVKSKKKADIASMENLLILTDDSVMPTSSSLSHSVASPVSSRRNSRSPNLPNEKNVHKKSSNINVRDSIEIFQRRTSSGSTMKKDAGYNKSYIINNTNNYKGQAKHYRGDLCAVPDPSERDKEIRQLLGILTGRNLNEPLQDRETEESFVTKHHEEGCKKNECSNKKVTLSSSLAKLFPKKMLAKLQYQSIPKEEDCNNQIKFNELKNSVSTKLLHEIDPVVCEVTRGVGRDYLTSAISQHFKFTDDIKKIEQNIDSSISLNKNIHKFLNMEQLTKQKAILLTRKQYDKVKRTIRSTACKKFSNERKKNYFSSVSIGEVRMKAKFQRGYRLSKEVQTDDTYYINKDIISDSLSDRDESKFRTDYWFRRNIEREDNTIKEVDKNKNGQLLNMPRKVSSVEVRYASISFMKHVTYSTPLKADSCYSDRRHSNSIHTIFKGHKRSVTPNLGTSAYSLYSSNSGLTTTSKPSRLIDSKKKPLLQRLVSCLIMRSKVSPMKIEKLNRKQQSQNSSINSYNISTTFAGVEIPSSLYDTSVSFYSNHTIMPVNKMKRSFFSSVKGFLTHHRL